MLGAQHSLLCAQLKRWPTRTNEVLPRLDCTLCRAMPHADIERRQAALDRERHKLSYAPGPDGYSEVADAALASMLRWGASLSTS